MKALVLENKVIETAETSFEVHESMSWHECSSNVEAGWSFDGETFLPPPQPEGPSLRDRISTIHQEKLYGGVAMGDITVRTDALTVAKLADARLSALLNTDFKTDWHFGDDVWETLTSTKIIDLYNLVEQHEVKCYKAKRYLIENIDTIEDLETEWNNGYNS